ncbi:MAG: heme-binding protein [Rhodospirillales bacterium]|nr:heme-binding protein [Alphaproteobacteria bacterium]MCY4431431.1 heme-binding protein [Rhodospirillales bacterium]
MQKFAALLIAGIFAAGMAPAMSAAHVEMRPMLTLGMAKAMADACEAFRETQEDFRPVNIAIVDRGADLVLFRRQNDSFLGSFEIALRKAQSAARLPFPTRTLGAIVHGTDGKPGRAPALGEFHHITALTGGLPIRMADGALVGAIGVSGATGDQDEQCAQAAIDAVADMLQ